MKTTIIGILVCMLMIVVIINPVVGVVKTDDSSKRKSIIFENAYQKEEIFDDDWPQFKHDVKGTGYLNISGPQISYVEWDFEFYPHGSLPPEAYSSPIIAYGNVYMGSNGEYFHCLDAYTGKQIWIYYIPGGTSSSSAAVYEGKVYQGVVYDYIYCWNATTGSLIWQHYCGYGMAWAPTIHEGKVFIVKQEGYANEPTYLYCLDADNGTKLWDFGIGEFECRTCPVVNNGSVYFTSGDKGFIYCLNASDGNILWSKYIEMAQSSPAFYNDKIYVGGKGLYCLDAVNGSTIWRYNPGFLSHRSPVVSNGRVYLCCNGTTCFDAESGEIIWNNPYAGSLFPAVSNNFVYVGKKQSGSVVCLSVEDGTKQWEYQVGYPGHPIGAAALGYGRLYVSGGSYMNPVLHCFKDPSSPPDTPTINGPPECISTYEHEFEFSSSDPETNDVQYYVDWGDGTNTGWIGPYPSGKIIKNKHSWSDAGSYTIKVIAKDEYEMQSQWSEITITVIDAPILEIQPIKGGLFSLSTKIKNDGRNDASDVAWSIILDGGFIIFGKKLQGTIEFIPIEEEATIKSDIIFGFGKVLVAVSATVPEGISDTREQIGSVFLFIIKINTSG